MLLVAAFRRGVAGRGAAGEQPGVPPQGDPGFSQQRASDASARKAHGAPHMADPAGLRLPFSLQLRWPLDLPGGWSGAAAGRNGAPGARTPRAAPASTSAAGRAGTPAAAESAPGSQVLWRRQAGGAPEGADPEDQGASAAPAGPVLWRRGDAAAPPGGILWTRTEEGAPRAPAAAAPAAPAGSGASSAGGGAAAVAARAAAASSKYEDPWRTPMPGLEAQLSGPNGAAQDARGDAVAAPDEAEEQGPQQAPRDRPAGGGAKSGEEAAAGGRAGRGSGAAAPGQRRSRAALLDNFEA